MIRPLKYSQKARQKKAIKNIAKSKQRVYNYLYNIVYYVGKENYDKSN